MSEAGAIQTIEGFIVESSARFSQKSDQADTFVYVLSLWAELISCEESRKLAEQQNAIKARASKPSVGSKKTQPGSKKAQRGGGGAKPTEITTEEQDKGVEVTDTHACGDDIPSVRADVPLVVESLTSELAGFAEEPEVEADPLIPDSDASTPLTKEQIHQSVFDKVMATVPEGRIHQRVLDRLIGKWLKITQMPLGEIQMMVRGSHRAMHGDGGGLILVKRHGGDTTHSPYEVRDLAEKFVKALAPQ